MAATRLRCLSLFTGAGGLDLGFEAAGFEHVGSVERDRDARKTLSANRPNWPQLRGGDITSQRADEILAEFGIKPNELELITAGPPCQPFSKSAFWASGTTARLGDPRADTLRAMMDVVEKALPSALVVENVRGIAYKDKDEGIQLIRQRLAEINAAHGSKYELSITCLQATDYGVAQLRERAFLVAFRSGAAFVKPTPITGENTENPIPTAWDALSTVEVPTSEATQLAVRGKWADLLPSIPEGKNYLWHTPQGGGEPLFAWRSRFWSFLLKLAKDRPSWTIQAAPGSATGPFHWNNRRLSIAEMARLQSFPPNYRFSGSYNSARRQIGNAVPSSLAEAVARRVRSIILNEPYNSSLSLAISPCTMTPPPAQTSDVAQKYMPLKGQHPAHPGTGLGPGALRRIRSAEYPLVTNGGG